MNQSRRAVWTAISVALVVSVLASPSARRADAQVSAEPFPLVDTVVVSRNTVGNPGLVTQLFADQTLGLVIAKDATRFHVFDAATMERRSPAGGIDPGLSNLGRLVDEVDHRLFTSANPFGQAPVIGALSLVQEGRAAEFHFPSPEYDNQSVVAMAHDPEAGILYAVTQVATAAPTVHALGVDPPTADNPAGSITGLLWSFSVDSCAQVATNGGNGFLGHSSDGFLYLFCSAPKVLFAENASPPAGAVRLDVGEVTRPDRNLATSGARTAEGIRVEFFPVDADMSQGLNAGGGDDRVLAAAASAGNQKLFVFDASHRAWTGSTPLGGGNVRGAFTDPATGRTYVLQAPSGAENDRSNLIVTHATGLPVAQGDAILLRNPVGEEYDPGGTHPVALAVTMPDGDVRQRLFVQNRDNVGDVNLLVYDDRLPLPPDPVLVNPDDNTSQIEEEPGVTVTYGGEGSAYGARLTSVGGVGSVSQVGSALETVPGDFPRPSDGDRGSLFGWVELARLAGDEGGGNEAVADAVRLALDEGTESDVANLPPPPDELSAETAPSSCNSAREEDQAEKNPGSAVACDVDGESVSASAASHAGASEALPFEVGSATSSVSVHRDAELGVVVESEAVARGVTVGVEGVGYIHLGEVGALAKAVAKGKAGSAESKYEPIANQVRLVGPDGKTVYFCETCDPFVVAAEIERFAGPRVKAYGPRRELDPLVTGSPGGAEARVIKDAYATVSDGNINNDDLIAVTTLQLELYHDGRSASREVIQLGGVFASARYTLAPGVPVEPLDPAALVVELLDHAGDPLAGGMFEVRTAADVGAPDPLPLPDDGAGSDDDDDGNEGDEGEEGEGEEGDGDGDGDGGGGLANAAVEGDGEDPNHDDGEGTENGDTERGDDESKDPIGDIVDDPLDAGELIGACVTADDGIGDCTFDDLEPGSYLVTQTAAPAGFAEAPPFPVVLTPGFASTVTFTNVKSTATIEISLSDIDGNPLPDGDFAVLADDGDGLLGSADVEVGRCTTGGDGTCQPLEVPVGAYVVHQASAPAGLEPADDVAFSFTAPGESAVLAFVNGRPAVPAVESAGGDAPFAPGPPSMVSSGSVDITPAPPAPPPMVTSTPLDPSPRSPLKRMAGIPGEALGFLTRSPAEAALFAGVWGLLLAPAYLASRRRKLIFVKEGT